MIAARLPHLEPGAVNASAVKLGVSGDEVATLSVVDLKIYAAEGAARPRAVPAIVGGPGAVHTCPHATELSLSRSTPSTPAAAFKQGLYEQACTIYSQALAEQPEDSSALCNRSVARLRLGEHCTAARSRRRWCHTPPTQCARPTL
jgi:hypothetical protein